MKEKERKDREQKLISLELMKEKDSDDNFDFDWANDSNDSPSQPEINPVVAVLPGTIVQLGKAVAKPSHFAASELAPKLSISNEASATTSPTLQRAMSKFLKSRENTMEKKKGERSLDSYVEDDTDLVWAPDMDISEFKLQRSVESAVDDDDAFSNIIMPDDTDAGDENSYWRLKREMGKVLAQLKPDAKPEFIAQACSQVVGFIETENVAAVREALLDQRLGALILFVEMLELDDMEILKAVLRTVNKIVSSMVNKVVGSKQLQLFDPNSDSLFQESLALVGLIPAVLKFANHRYPLHIRVEASHFAVSFCRYSQSSRLSFVACGGLKVLVQLMETAFLDEGTSVVQGTIDCVQCVLDMKATMKNDFLRLFCKFGLLKPLVERLFDIVEKIARARSRGPLLSGELLADETNSLLLLEASAEKLAVLFKVFALEGDAAVKLHCVHVEVMKVLLKVLNGCNIKIQNTLVFAISLLVFEAKMREMLHEAGAIKVLVGLLSADTDPNLLRHTLNSLIPLVRISEERQDEAARVGMVPRLIALITAQNHIQNNNKQFFPRLLFGMCNFSGPLIRMELSKHGGVKLFVSLLRDLHERKDSLKALSDWLQAEPARMSFLLTSTTNLNKLINCFKAVQVESDVVEVAGYFLQMCSVPLLSARTRMQQALAGSSVFVTELLGRFEKHKDSKNNFLKLPLLKLLNILLPSDLKQLKNFAVRFAVIEKLEALKGRQGDNQFTMGLSLVEEIIGRCRGRDHRSSRGLSLSASAFASLNLGGPPPLPTPLPDEVSGSISPRSKRPNGLNDVFNLPASFARPSPRALPIQINVFPSRAEAYRLEDSGIEISDTSDISLIVPAGIQI